MPFWDKRQIGENQKLTKNNPESLFSLKYHIKYNYNSLEFCYKIKNLIENIEKMILHLYFSIGQKSSKILTANSLNPFSDLMDIMGHTHLYKIAFSTFLMLSVLVATWMSSQKFQDVNSFFKSQWNSKNSPINFTRHLKTKKLLKFVWQSDNFSFY